MAASDSGPAPADFGHAPILLAKVVALAQQHACSRLLDCTVGGAGHSQALLAALPQARLLALDRDRTAVAVAEQRLARFAGRARVVHAPFSTLGTALSQAPYAGPPDFVLADFGVSSHQLDTAQRGFSFRFDGPLDMRMDPSQGETAAELIGRLDADALAHVLWTLGEERHSRRIARAIVAQKPRTTLQLAQVVRAQLPRPKRGHPIDAATRTFQALRMAVNDELGEIEKLLAAAIDAIADGGVLVALSFHSLEDRMVKRAVQRHAAACLCPPGLPACACGQVPQLRWVQRKASTADAAECAGNPRARSAKLRWAVRLPRPAVPHAGAAVPVDASR